MLKMVVDGGFCFERKCLLKSINDYGFFLLRIFSKADGGFCFEREFYPKPIVGVRFKHILSLFLSKVIFDVGFHFEK